MASAIQGWLVLLCSLGFVGVSLWLVILGRGGTGPIAAMIFFGACAAVGAWMISSRRRILRQGEDRSLEVSVTGGVPIPVDRRRMVATSAGLVVFGLALAATGGPIGDEFVSACLVIAGFGALIGVLLVFGWRRGFALVFTPAGLRCETPKLAYLVAWDRVEAISLQSMNNTPVIILCVDEPAALASAAEVRRGDPGRVRAKLARSLEKSRRWFGGDLMISPSAYGLDPVFLLRALERYAGDPAARASLREKAAVGSGAG